MSVATLRRLLLGMRRVVLHPALAVGLVLLLLYPVATTLIAGRDRREPVETPLEAVRRPRAADSERARRTEQSPEPAAAGAAGIARGGAPPAPGGPGSQEPGESPPARAPAHPRATLSRVGTPLELERARVHGGLALRMRPPHFSERGAAARVRILSPDGTRELHEAASVGVSDGMVEINIPEAWLEPGAYRVEVRVGEAGSEAERLVLYRFRVR